MKEGTKKCYKIVLNSKKKTLGKGGAKNIDFHHHTKNRS